MKYPQAAWCGERPTAITGAAPTRARLFPVPTTALGEGTVNKLLILKEASAGRDAFAPAASNSCVHERGSCLALWMAANWSVGRPDLTSRPTQ